MAAITELPLPGLAVATERDELAPPEVAAPVSAILAARRGDQASMRAIYEAEAPRLVRRLRHLTGSLALAQDLTHDVFVVAFCGRASFDGNAAISTWLYGIARNKWRDERRKLERRRALLAAHPSEPSTSADTSEVVVIGEIERRLDLALGQLSEPLREAFVLRVLEGLPLREAAQLAGVGLSSMSKRAHAAELKVRAAIEAQERS